MPAQDADIVDQARAPAAASTLATGELQFQPAGFLLQLSLDWIVLRASENIDEFLGESHVTLIDEPFGRFVQAQALHDLRNHFARLSGSTGVARAYRIRLAHDRPAFDIAFQVSDGRVLLEGVPSGERSFGAVIGSVGGLIDGMPGRGESLLEAAARRVRALTGSDQCLLIARDDADERSALSSRGNYGTPVPIPDLPPIVAASSAAGVPLFPRKPGDSSIASALLRAPSAQSLQRLSDQGIGSAMSVPLSIEGRDAGLIQCGWRSPREPSFELHAATQLFAQMLALRLEVDRLRGA